MADEEDQPVTPVAPPPQAIVPRGTGYTYSTPGPANWQNPQTAAGPGGPVQIPQNAQNFTSIVGPPPEDQETAAFRKMFNSLPMDQAIKAYQAAKQFQGQRVLQSKLAGYSAAGLPPEQALSRAMTDAAAVGLFSTPKEMLDLHKGLSTANIDKAKQQFETQKMLEQGRMGRAQLRASNAIQRLPPTAQIDDEDLKDQIAQKDKIINNSRDYLPDEQQKAATERAALVEKRRALRGPQSAGPLPSSSSPVQMAPEPTEKPLDKATALKFLKQAKGDKAKARQMAKDAGYTF